MKMLSGRFVSWSRTLALFGLLAASRMAFASGTAEEPSLADAAKRGAELRSEIAKADELYFKKNAPEISDAAYDELKRELVVLETAYPQLKSRSAGEVTGDDRAEGFASARHGERMLSLRKTYSPAELRLFHEQLVTRIAAPDAAFVIEPKFDGLAISVTYQRGKLIRAATRGDGDRGDDVTANVLTIGALPHTIKMRPTTESAAVAIPDLVELRGEIFMSFAEFRRINASLEEEGKEPFANPRNLAAGTIKLHDRAQVARRKLEIVFYGMGACEPASARPPTQVALHQLIREWGIPGVAKFETAHGGDEIWQAVDRIGRERGGYPFPTDGAVVKLNDVRLQNQVGASLEAPNWAVAYKFVPAQALTQLRGITVQVGRTGLLTPVAELVPVNVGGSLVARASLHNFAEIARRDIRVGDFVWIEKAGEIIPAIARVERERRGRESRAYVWPTKCPSCGSSIVRDDGKVPLRCRNPGCAAQLRRRLAHFCGKSSMAIEGLGPAMIDKLVAAGALTCIADVYRLRERREERATVVVGAPVLASIERSKRAELWRVVNGLGIPGVGVAAAKVLGARFQSLASFAAAKRADYFSGDRLMVDGLSRSAAESVLEFFERSENQDAVAELISAGLGLTTG